MVKAAMNNKIKLALINFIVIFVFIISINLISRYTIKDGIEQIELDQAKIDMSQLYSLFEAESKRLNNWVYDWAVFDGSYDYINTRNSYYITANFSKERLHEHHLIGVAFYDIEATRIQFVDGSENLYSEEWINDEIRHFDNFTKQLKSNQYESETDFIEVNGTGLIISAHKVYDSSKNKSPVGYFVAASALDSSFQDTVYRISGIRFFVHPMDAYYSLFNDTTHLINFTFEQTDKHVKVYSRVNDTYGNPVFCIELLRNRDIAEFGNLISKRNTLCMIVLCIIILLSGFIMITIAYRRFHREEIIYRANHDMLTGLPNRRLYRERLKEFINQEYNGQNEIGILYIDIDNFKGINDSFGYSSGDELLKQFSSRLKKICRNGSPARVSVDNFVLFLSSQSKENIIQQANVIYEALVEPYIINKNKIHISISIGISFVANNSYDEKLMIHKAELAMFEAQKHGGGTISCFSDYLIKNALSKKQIEIALYEALDKNILSVHYQPKIDIHKKDVCGCEALIRWQTSDGEWVPPPQFIPLAEETGLVTRIDMFVLQQACKQVIEWKKNGLGSIPIAVNMSVRSIMSGDFAEKVINTLRDEGTPPELIDIEITESCFISDIENAFSSISRLHEAGIRIAVDDFGTGYSSLQYLSAMPISFLKIDKKFIDDIFSGKVTAQPLVKSIMSLATNLGMHTISEGVESKKQLDFITNNGGHIIQGYLFSKPLNPIDCCDFLKNQKVYIDKVLNAA